MSKIALESNPSGTGTFTIKSPNSNVDRELTLPDSAGEIYNRGNILGTVSQSGGVPTGAIIERGSNTNGEFVRYADGTQICKLTFTGIAVNLPPNTVTLITWIFPTTFAVNPSYFNLIGTPDTSIDFFGVIFYELQSTTSATFVIKNGATTQNFINPKFFAIGRWF
jgi:hypothetical protein